MIKRSRLSHGEDKSRTAIGEDCGVKALWSEGVVERRRCGANALGSAGEFDRSIGSHHASQERIEVLPGTAHC